MLFIDKAYNYNDLIKRLRNSTIKLLDNKTNKYVNLLQKQYPNIYLGGRLGLYKYIDMDDTIELAMDFCKNK